MFPASAGMILAMAIPANAANSVPRIRGDDPLSSGMPLLLPLCSPHPRG